MWEDENGAAVHYLVHDDTILQRRFGDASQGSLGIKVGVLAKVPQEEGGLHVDREEEAADRKSWRGGGRRRWRPGEEKGCGNYDTDAATFNASAATAYYYWDCRELL